MANVDEMILVADMHIAQWANDLAIQVLQDILLQNPEYARAYNHLWRIYQNKLDYYEKAKKFYQTWLSIDPNYQSLHINYCYLLLDLSQFDDLIKAANNAFQVPAINQATLWYVIACSYEKQYIYEEAIKNYKKSILNSMDNDKIKYYEDCIARCEKKVELKNSL